MTRIERTLVLASRSPRRVELLRRAGIPCRVRPAQVNEQARPGETPNAYVRRLARQKAEAAQRPGEWVLGADTVVVIDGHILGKPRNPREAARMLRLLSGRVHTGLTGIFLLRGRGGEEQAGAKGGVVSNPRGAQN